MDNKEHKIKTAAYEMGFQYVGFSKATFLEDEAPRLEAWLHKGLHGSMQYMENHFDKRLDPRLLVDNAQSVITLLYNYYTEKKQNDPQAPKISQYAFGKDYHFVVKDKLKKLTQYINDEICPINARIFVDSAPVLERAWAAKSGAGWIGKNAMLINKQAGSFFFLAEIICDLPLQPDSPTKDYCGTCRRCIEACPTNAIIGDKIIDASRCISYFTIELKDALLPQQMQGKFDNWMFGCDVCQDVCPWNRFAAPHQEPAFEPHPDLLNMNRREWTELTEEIFAEIFKQSAVKRTKFVGLKRNIQFLDNKKSPLYMPHRLYILLCCCFMGAIAAPRLQAQSDTLTANAQINLITADPGTEIYSYFGHSALQVRDTTLGIDRVFNYGTFDFNTPNFYGKFVQGRLNYKLSAAQFEPFLENYIEDNRSLYSQTLNLTPAETQTLYRLLLTNYKPENREYLYDFFFDNCATRIRDIIEKTLPNRLHYDSTAIDKPLTFRQLVNIYTHQNKWLDFGIDLILGAKTDRIAQAREYMFLPDYLKIAFDKAKIDSNGTRIPLVKSSETLFKATPIAEAHGIGAIVSTPQSLFAILCVVGIFASIIAQRRGQLLAWLDNVWLSILGILGILLLFFWFGTDHKVLVNNYNLLWAMPLHLPFLWFRPKLSAVQQRYYWIFTDILLLLAVFIALFQKPQGLHAAIMPLCCLFIFRCAINIAATYPPQKAQH